MGIDLNVLVTLIFGAGAGGVVAGVINVVKTLRSGKIENEETLIRRLDIDNKKQQQRAEDAEAHADQAVKEAEEYRKQRNDALEELSLLRFYVMETYGDQPPRFGKEK